MQLHSSRLRALALVVGLIALVATPAVAAPVFGPNVYERTAGPPDIYTETFAAPAGLYGLWVANGDDAGNRVTAGSIVVNGNTVVTSSDFNNNVPHFVKPLQLNGSQNSLTITLGSDPGSFITVAVMRFHERPELTAGRLLLPWANVTNLVIDLKNGSHRFPRRVRLIFYDAAGQAVASSGRVTLAPRASLSALASTLIANGAWTQGSVEIFYGGRGHGRVFGQAVVTDGTTSVSSVIPLQHAGHRVVDLPRPNGPTAVPDGEATPEAEAGSTDRK